MNPLTAIGGSMNLRDLATYAAKGQAMATPAADQLSRSAELGAMQPPLDLPSVGNTGATDGSFSNLLHNAVQEVSGKQNAATAAVNGLLTGQNVSLHQAVIAMEEATVSFQLMIEVRNKMLEGYQEIMRMQL
jgi:flagellar hook-basal body complex protein FliE